MNWRVNWKLSGNWIWEHAISSKDAILVDILLEHSLYPMSFGLSKQHKTHVQLLNLAFGTYTIFGIKDPDNYLCPREFATQLSAPMFRDVVARHKAELVALGVLKYFSDETLLELYKHINTKH